MKYYYAFNKEWFKKHQKKLLWCLRFRLFRWLLKIKTDKKIIQITPSSFTLFIKRKRKKVYLQGTFYSGLVYSKRIYKLFKPIWWLMHFWDWLVAERFLPQLSFGFPILTQFTGSIGANNPVDGLVRSANANYTTAHDASSGDALDDTSASANFCEQALIAGTYYIRHGYFVYDTSSIGGSSTINSATLSLFGAGTTSNADSDSISIVSSNPASTTALALGDYPSVGATKFATDITFASWSTSAYNDFSLNSSGLTNISKTGNSKFGTRTAKDISATAPAGTSNITCAFSETAGTSNDPKLVVNYSPGGGSGFLTLGVGS